MVSNKHQVALCSLGIPARAQEGFSIPGTYRANLQCYDIEPSDGCIYAYIMTPPRGTCPVNRDASTYYTLAHVAPTAVPVIPANTPLCCGGSCALRLKAAADLVVEIDGRSISSFIAPRVVGLGTAQLLYKPRPPALFVYSAGLNWLSIMIIPLTASMLPVTSESSIFVTPLLGSPTLRLLGHGSPSSMHHDGHEKLSHHISAEVGVRRRSSSR